MRRSALGAASLLILAAAPLVAQHADRPTETYFAFVLLRPIDMVTLIRFGPGGAAVVHRTSLRLDPAVASDPQAIDLAPDGRHYYVTIGNGLAGGGLLRIAIAADSSPYGQPTDTVTGREPLEGTPGAVAVLPGSEYAWVDGAGSSRQSAMTIVYLPQMVEATRIATCRDGRGATLDQGGTRLYAVCAAGDSLLEFDVRGVSLVRRIVLPPAASGRRCGAEQAVADAAGRVYVACDSSGEVLVVEPEGRGVERRIAVPGVRRIGVTADGHRVVALVGGIGPIAVIDVAAGEVTARLSTRRVVLDEARAVAPWMPDPFLVAAMWATGADPVGVALTPDGRYALVAEQASGSTSSTVDIVDLASGKQVATLPIGLGAGPVIFWKVQTK